jgi:general secretion pathway protein E
MRRPQDGHFRREIEGRNLDIRVSTIPAIFGEKIVLRLQDRTRDLLRIDALGMDEDVRETFRAAIKRPHGLILVTGPTGSGKTTTLYAALSERNHQGLNLTTIEDPVEFDLFGVNQIQINPKIDVTFAKGLRHILRQDPDIILVGEIRDKETADVAIQAAMTGHLVLSTLHTNDSIGAIARLVDMGVPAFLIADSLLAVLSQRLVRRLCPLCRKESTLTPEEAAMLNAEATEKIYRAGACSSCLGTGYRGRMGLYEFLSIAPPIAGLIRVRSSSDELIQSARQSGFRTLREDGRTKIREGLTTVDEVERVS